MIRFKSFIVETYMTPEHGTQYGSNPGGIHHDESGVQRYVKFYRDPEQGRVETLTGQIYKHMGIHTLEPEFRPVNGRDAVVTRWNHDLEPVHHKEFERLSPDQHRDVGRMYHGAILTKNWDILGLGHDNVMRHRGDGRLFSVDHGGAFHFRAQGGPKDYGPDIGEHHSLRHNDQASGHVFHHVLSKDPEAYRAGHEATANMDMDHVRRLFERSGLRNADELHHNFVKRRESLLDKTS